jgi:hypothetical protein
MNNPREKIVNAFSEWTAFSATRSGCPIKSREEVYPLIRVPDYNSVIIREKINQEAFDQWHEENTLKIKKANPILPIGWATKLINIYLKTRIYVGKEGCLDLIKCIHPPIDNGLWEGIKKEYGSDREIIYLTHKVDRIKNIDKYSIYKTIIDGCKLIAQKRNCYLIEVEELWQGNVI